MNLNQTFVFFAVSSFAFLTQNLIAHPLTSVPLLPDHWEVVYDGYGKVEFHADHLSLKPHRPLNEQTTHAALLLLNKTRYSTPQNFKARIRYKTRSQLRSPRANPWEVFWLMFNTQVRAGHFASANYLIQKPGLGFELGRASAGDVQDFLATDTRSSLDVNEISELEVLKLQQSLVIWQNGILRMRYDGDATSSNNFLFNEKGQLGLYTEDAWVEIYEFSYIDLDK